MDDNYWTDGEADVGFKYSDTRWRDLIEVAKEAKKDLNVEGGTTNVVDYNTHWLARAFALCSDNELRRLESQRALDIYTDLKRVVDRDIYAGEHSPLPDARAFSNRV